MLLGRVIKMDKHDFCFVIPIVRKEEILEHFEETRDLKDEDKYLEFKDFVKSKIGKYKKYKNEDNVHVHNTKCKPKSINDGDIVFLEAWKTKKGRLSGKIHFVVWRQYEQDFFPSHKTNIVEEKKTKENSNSTVINNRFEPISQSEMELLEKDFIKENENYISHSEITNQGGEPIISRKKINRIGENKNWIKIDDIPKSVNNQEAKIEEYQRKRMQKLGAEVDCWVNDDEEGKLFFKVIWGKNNGEFIVKHRDIKYNLKRCKNVQDYYYIEIDSELIGQEEFIIYNKSNKIEIPISRITKNFESKRLLLEIDSSNSNIIIHSKNITKDGPYPPDFESRIQIKLDILDWSGGKWNTGLELNQVFLNDNSIFNGSGMYYKRNSFTRLSTILIGDNLIEIDINSIMERGEKDYRNIAAWKVREISIISKEKNITYSIKRMDAMHWQALSSIYKHKVILNPYNYDKWQNDNANYKIDIPYLIAADTHPTDDVGDLIIEGKNINLNEIDKTEENIVRGVFRHISVTECLVENLESIGKLRFKMKIDVTANIDEIIKDCFPNITKAEIIQMNPELNLKQEGASIYFIKNIIVNENLQNHLKGKKLEQWFISFIIKIDRKGSESLVKFNLEKCFEYSLPYLMFLHENRPIIITNQFYKEIYLFRGSTGVTGKSKYVTKDYARAIGISKDYSPLDYRHCIDCTIIDGFDLSGSLVLKTSTWGDIISRVSEKDKNGLKPLKEFKGWDVGNKTDDTKILHSKDDVFNLPPDFIRIRKIIFDSEKVISIKRSLPLKVFKKPEKVGKSNIQVRKTKVKGRKFGTVRGGRGEKRR